MTGIPLSEGCCRVSDRSISFFDLDLPKFRMYTGMVNDESGRFEGSSVWAMDRVRGTRSQTRNSDLAMSMLMWIRKMGYFADPAKRKQPVVRLFASRGSGKRFLKNLASKRFGRLKVLDKRKSERRVNSWLCQCDCGQILWARAIGLHQGSTRSCGCLSRELSSRRARLLKKRHRVVLTKEDRSRLSRETDAMAHIILLADESQNGPGLTDAEIAKQLGVTRTKVEYTQTKFVASRDQTQSGSC